MCGNTIAIIKQLGAGKSTPLRALFDREALLVACYQARSTPRRAAMVARLPRCGAFFDHLGVARNVELPTRHGMPNSPDVYGWSRGVGFDPAPSMTIPWRTSAKGRHSVWPSRAALAATVTLDARLPSSGQHASGDDLRNEHSRRSGSAATNDTTAGPDRFPGPPNVLAVVARQCRYRTTHRLVEPVCPSSDTSVN